MVVTQKELHDFKVELNSVLERLDARLKALEEPKGAAKPKAKTSSQGVDKAS